MLQDANRAAWNGNLTTPPGELTRNIKKCTAFIKKLRLGFSKEKNPALLAELATLDLSMYVAEAAAATYDALQYKKVASSCEMIVALHQRLGAAFTSSLLSMLLVGSLDEDIPRRLVFLRILVMLNSESVFSSMRQCNLALLTPPLEALYKKNPENPVAPLAAKFLELPVHLIASDALPLVRLCAKVELAVDFSHFVKKLFTAYTRAIEAHRESLMLCKVSSGAERQRNKQKAEKEAELVLLYSEFVDALRDLFPEATRGLDIRVQPETQVALIKQLFAKAVGGQETQTTDPKAWRNEEEREIFAVFEPLTKIDSNLYANLLDIEKVRRHIQRLVSTKDVKKFDVLAQHQVCLPDRDFVHEEILAALKVGVSLRLLARFVKSCANEALRAKAVTSVKDAFLRALTVKRLEVDAITCFSDFVKMGLVKRAVALGVAGHLTANVQNPFFMNVWAFFMGQCGQYLFHSPEKEELLKRMQSVSNQLERSVHKPAERDALREMVGAVELQFLPRADVILESPKTVFLQQLLSSVLAEDTRESVVAYLGKVDFVSDKEAMVALTSVFTAPENIPLDRYTLLAGLLVEPFLASRVVDALVELIMRGMEVNNYKLNARRIAQMRMVAAMSTCGLLGYASVAELLYKVVCHGYPGGFRLAKSIPSDPKKLHFRAQMCCALLSGLALDPAKEEINLLEEFLLFFQYYLCCKPPVPEGLRHQVDVIYGAAQDAGLEATQYSDPDRALQAFRLFKSGNRTKEELQPDPQPADVVVVSAEEDRPAENNEDTGMRWIEAMTNKIGNLEEAGSSFPTFGAASRLLRGPNNQRAVKALDWKPQKFAFENGPTSVSLLRMPPAVNVKLLSFLTRNNDVKPLSANVAKSVAAKGPKPVTITIVNPFTTLVKSEPVPEALAPKVLEPVVEDLPAENDMREEIVDRILRLVDNMSDEEPLDPVLGRTSKASAAKALVEFEGIDDSDDGLGFLDDADADSDADYKR